MKKIKTFESFNKVLSREDCTKLFSLEENDLGPTDRFTDNEFEDFLNTYTGMSIEDYAKHRYPDNYEKQLRMALEVLDK